MAVKRFKDNPEETLLVDDDALVGTKDATNGDIWVKMSTIGTYVKNFIGNATTSIAGLMSGPDKLKLDNIEDNAQVNPSDSEIKTAYENNANTNPFTDADQSSLASAEQTANKGVANGYPELDGSGRVPVAQIPSGLTPGAHASSHTDGTDDIQDATPAQKGLMTPAQATALNSAEQTANKDVANGYAGLSASGEISPSVIPEDSVGNDEMENMPGNSVKANPTSAAGNPQDLALAASTILARLATGDLKACTPAEIRTLLNVADAANAYIHPNHSGHVVSAGDGATTIQPGVVTNAMAVNMAGYTFKANNNAAPGTPSDIGIGANTVVGRGVAGIGLGVGNNQLFGRDGGNLRALTVSEVKSVLSYAINDMSDVDTTTDAPNSGDLLSWDGSNWVPVLGYIKSEGGTIVASPNFNSVVFTNVPGLTFNTPRDGDYIIYCLIKANSDDNASMSMTVAVNGTADTDLQAAIRFQKNTDESIQATFPLDGLSTGDVITFQMDTGGDNLDLQERRWIYQSWA